MEIYSSILSRVSADRTSFCISNIGIISRAKVSSSALVHVECCENLQGKQPIKWCLMPKDLPFQHSQDSMSQFDLEVCFGILTVERMLNCWKDVNTKRSSSTLLGLSWAKGHFASQHLSRSKCLPALFYTRSIVRLTRRAKSPSSGVMWGTWEKLMTKFWPTFYNFWNHRLGSNKSL